MIKLPKDDICEYPAYLFWKMQSRLTKLANHLEKIHKTSSPDQVIKSNLLGKAHCCKE